MMSDPNQRREAPRLPRIPMEIPHWVYEKGVIIKTYDVVRWGMNLWNCNHFILDTRIKGYRVTTICLGIDYGFGFSGYPVLFEIGINTQPIGRYCFLNIARAAHWRFVRAIRNGDLDEELRELFDEGEDEAWEQQEGEE